ncbi:aldo/keto reductase [Leeuwenhoekiella sp. NPDC079379]|uniref:aldo/keto reductase n=1 Tax=Leeuwenhoekiella sp. NPDC079379 TaxID=3364122 RepID=UPI0037CC135D
MEYIQLGKTDIKIPPITFGGNVFGWTADKKTSFYLLDALLDKGFNFIDSANVYSYWAEGNSGGESETIIGEWMQALKNRDKIILATKVGSPMGSGAPDLSASYINEQIELSLKRLQTEYVDVYFSHKYDDSTPQRETLSVYKNLINAGKVRQIGASNFPLAILREAIELSKEDSLPRYEVIQPEYNLMERAGFEGEYQRFCIENNLSVTSYFTLASGFLTGKYDSKGAATGKDREPFLKKYFNDKGEAVLNALKVTAQKHKVSEAAITLAWTMAQPGITSPIASATKKEHLQAFDEALHLNLDQEDYERLNSASE